MTLMYCALLATSGMRPGLEIETLTWPQIKFEQNSAGQESVTLFVRPSAGKYSKARKVWVRKQTLWPIETMLRNYRVWIEDNASDRYRKANPTGQLFYRPHDGIKPNFSVCVRDMLIGAGVRIDPETGQARVAYSFRHYYATMMLLTGIPHALLCANMGTSLTMLNDHYGHVIAGMQSDRLTGHDVYRRQNSDRAWDDLTPDEQQNVMDRVLQD